MAAVAVTTHHLATDAAAAILEAGGTAADAAVAANAVVGVVLPDTCGPGGDLFALVHRPGDPSPAALNASGRAGSGADADALRHAGYTGIPLRHPATVTVPGCVDGWEALLDRFGRLGMAKVLAPAISLARDGFPVSAELAASLRRDAALVAGEDSMATFYADGPAASGAAVRRPDLAATLDAVASGGRTAFYQGDAGAGVTAATAGIVTPEDLSRNQAEWVAPLGLAVHGREAWTIPPNSQGYITLAACWIAEHFGAEPDLGSPAYHHALIEAYRAASHDRDDVLSDPFTARLPPEALLDVGRLGERLSTISDHRYAERPVARRVPAGTTYLCVRDRDGLGVSLIQSNFHGFGSGLGAGATGVMLHNRGAGFTLEPGHPNRLAPGRRPLHTLSPSLWTNQGELSLLLGTRGGDLQPQILLQVASHLHRVGLPLAEAVAQPRWKVARRPGRPKVTVEDRMPATVVDGLGARGHTVVVTGAWQADWGPVAAIEVTATGANAAADPRVSTSSAS